MQKLIFLSIATLLFSCFYGCNKQDGGDNRDNRPNDGHQHQGPCGG